MASPRPALARLARSAAAGGGLGLCLFTVETALILRSGAIGLNVDVDGPFAALFAAVRPSMPSLLARIALAYWVGGVILGLAAALFVAALGFTQRRQAGLAFTCLLAMLVIVLAWDRAIARPAIFDDLPWLAGVLAFLADHGEPWQPRAVGLVLLAGLAALGVRAVLRRPALARRSPVAALAVGACLLGFLVHGTAARTQAPLVVVFGIDAFRPDRLKAYGGTGQVAPNLERFLGEATSFDRAYTPIAQTEPAYRSLLTARWPFATGVRYPLTAEERWTLLPTFPEVMSRAGWRTSFQTDCSRFNWQGEKSGFAFRRQPPRGALNFTLEKLRYRALGVIADNAAGAWLLPELIDNRAMAGIHDPSGYAKRLVANLAKDAASGPALFVFHGTAAHFPGDPVYPHYRRFVPAQAPLERRLRMVFSPIGSKGQGAGAGWGRAESEALYDELLGQADMQLGLVLEGLVERGLYDEATVVVFSDHGESFHADTPAIAGATPVHGARLSEEENRILFAVKLPRSKSPPARPRHIEALVRLIDLGPTLLELAGLPPLPDADGASLMPLLRGEGAPSRRLYAETGFTHASPDVFDPEHAAPAPRTFEAYRVRPEGIVELSASAHDAVMQEKDFGAFDGRSWWVRAPRKDGTVAERCTGACDDPTLGTWLTETMR